MTKRYVEENKKAFRLYYHVFGIRVREEMFLDRKRYSTKH